MNNNEYDSFLSEKPSNSNKCAFVCFWKQKQTNKTVNFDSGYF